MQPQPQPQPQPQSTPVDKSKSSPIKVSRKKKGKTKISTKEAAPADEQEKREYTGSTNTPEFGISLDDDDDDIKAEHEPPSRPMGRDKAKAKGKAMSSSDYEAKKLSLVEELAETNRVKKQAVKQFDQKIDKFYELEQRKIMPGFCAAMMEPGQLAKLIEEEIAGLLEKLELPPFLCGDDGAWTAVVVYMGDAGLVVGEVLLDLRLGDEG
ncbi:hypothetical protein L1987_65187 [Smallanthus sonchifolius]|uniref:Uncharacterized protein n=1 Tax=Smallanthus sonchifolius TaxID=185202 RepID=A0ACB9BTR6_9ASTR|nr:hypothetical protein L1987_65187 [Smallanthus sonchifolius]